MNARALFNVNHSTSSWAPVWSYIFIVFVSWSKMSISTNLSTDSTGHRYIWGVLFNDINVQYNTSINTRGPMVP